MASEVQEVAAQLGGRPVLGRLLRSDADVRDAIRAGFPQPVIQQVMAGSGLTLMELAETLDLSPRSLQRRKSEGRLAPHESDRLYRLARIVALAKRYIGDSTEAALWLKRPNRALGGEVPLSLIDTEVGARAVENILGRIAYGGIS
jgi:putative toxin-antitoxin system antitoxin component (TIGR02293 family)